ncbi:MAG: GDP-mannose 4,6-dehydratase [Pirellulales bacterium]
MSRRALVTGITGQDGYYLADLLLKQGYTVSGMLRPEPRQNFARIAPLEDRLTLEVADLSDQQSVLELVRRVAPDEIYNLAGNSFVPDSWQDPVVAGDVMGLGVVRLLEAVRAVNPAIRFLQVGSSEMFGQVDVEPQHERTPFRPRTPYGAAKVLAANAVANFRRHHGLFACTAIAFNHESPLRNKRFVVRKVTDAVARIKLGRQDKLILGNLDAARDWGFAGDYVRAMWMMLQRDAADDFVIATGEKHTVRRLVEQAFAHVQLDWQAHVEVDPQLFRPEDSTTLRGDSTKAQAELGWSPQIHFDELVRMMVDADLQQVRAESD